jgi:hypothetical protein
MKATITLLTALVVSALTFNTARAQSPIQPVMFGGQATAGGCADGNCGASGGCADGSCGKAHLFGVKTKTCQTCGDSNGSCGQGCGHKCHIFDCLCGCLKKSCPSTAPSCRKADYPLGFPNSPYVRSPRDYFMMESPSGWYQ